MLDGRYRLIEPIGAGAFGQVWKAHDPKVDRLVAVKVLTGDGSADNEWQVARFAREAAVAGGLSHPNIVTVHDFGSALQNGRQYAYLVMELLRGKPLNVVVEGGRLPLPKVMRTAACVADALGSAQGGQGHGAAWGVHADMELADLPSRRSPFGGNGLGSRSPSSSTHCLPTSVRK
ncbi:protein kinase domain-containing protein [Streptomyces capoamus]|uniref:protein kinase domain-containing protein n=1 Tax=Streptomyces capoamus TaxID=68183 RepID=UPI001E34B164|nr:protein kinase [Streptomyces capoamus]